MARFHEISALDTYGRVKSAFFVEMGGRKSNIIVVKPPELDQIAFYEAKPGLGSHNAKSMDLIHSTSFSADLVKSCQNGAV